MVALRIGAIILHAPIEPPWPRGNLRRAAIVDHVERLPHKSPSDPTYVDQMTWSAPGKPGVVLYAVHGGGHVVPTRMPKDWGGLGRETGDLDAPAAIWDFFSKLPSR